MSQDRSRAEERKESWPPSVASILWTAHHQWLLLPMIRLMLAVAHGQPRLRRSGTEEFPVRRHHHRAHLLISLPEARILIKLNGELLLRNTGSIA